MFKLNFSIEEVTKKINNIRSQFLEVNRTCNKKKLPSGSGSDSVEPPTWWLYDSLQFLLPYCKKDKGNSNIRGCSASQQEFAELLDSQHNEEEKGEVCLVAIL